jgi:eukaryotic-like serine/threonine-protein kinase
MSSGSATEATMEWTGGKTTASGPDLTGDEFDGQFVVRGQIGQGGMGSVLKVERRADPKPLALKYCHLAGAELKRFEREVRIMQRVRHPHVVPIVYANLEHSPPYFVMPLAEGSLLGELDRLKDNEANALEVFNQICAGVRALHASGIIHRDIKPANVLRFAGGRIAVSDFGLAKLDTRDSTILTQTNAFYGTFAYSAPEQHLPAGTREADARTDICQLGKMLYHMLTGKSPALIEQDALPRGLAHIVQRATSAHPEDRYQTLGELLDALRYYQLSKDPTRNLREALENLVLQAEDLLRRREYQAENLKAILGLLLSLDRLGHPTIIEFFDRLPREILPVLAGEFPGEFLPPLRAYAGAIQSRVAGFNFAYADTVARRMRSVFVHARNTEVKTAALQITLIAAVELNRFAAMNVFNSLLTTIKDVDLAIAVAEMLRAHSRFYQKVAEQVPPNRLHPAIREVQGDLLADSDEVPF